MYSEYINISENGFDIDNIIDTLYEKVLDIITNKDVTIYIDFKSSIFIEKKIDIHFQQTYQIIYTVLGRSLIFKSEHISFPGYDDTSIFDTPYERIISQIILEDRFEDFVNFQITDVVDMIELMTDELIIIEARCEYV